MPSPNPRATGAPKSYRHELRAAVYRLLTGLANKRKTLEPGRAEMTIEGLRVVLSIEHDPLEALTTVQRRVYDATDGRARKMTEISERAGYDSLRYTADAMRILVNLKLVAKVATDSYKRN